MKSIVESIHEAIEVDEARKPKDPKVGTTAYDYNGTPCKIIDIYDKKEDLEDFISDYDDSGVMGEEIDDLRPEIEAGNIILVAVEISGEEAVYVWGGEGVCYENK